MQIKEEQKQNLKMALLLSLTLGLAPFVPQPHIIGKIKWVWGGGHGMSFMDVLDLMMHGAPWIYLVFTIVSIGYSQSKSYKINQKITD
jgi:hypothetical protein